MPVRIDYFEKLCEICQAFGTARNRRELLEMIFTSAMEILEGKAACLYLMEPGKPELMPVAQKGLSESYFRSKQSMLVQKIVPLVLKKGFFYCRDAATDPKLAYPDAKKAEGIASILAVPVMVKGRNIGVFCLFTAAPKDFTPEEKKFLSLLAQQGGGVMEHARLIDHLHRETQLFFDLAVNLSSSLEVKGILHAMTTDLAKALVGVTGVSIRLLDETKETLELVASFGLSKKYLQKGPVSGAEEHRPGPEERQTGDHSERRHRPPGAIPHHEQRRGDCHHSGGAHQDQGEGDRGAAALQQGGAAFHRRGDQAGHRPGLSGGVGHPECLIVSAVPDGDEGPARGVVEPPVLVLMTGLPGKSGFMCNGHDLTRQSSNRDQITPEPWDKKFTCRHGLR